MSTRNLPEIRAAITELSRKFGKPAAANLTPEERSGRAKKASLAAAKKRTEQRLEHEGLGYSRVIARVAHADLILNGR